jgi:hypothetical protein
MPYQHFKAGFLFSAAKVREQLIIWQFEQGFFGAKIQE